MIRRGIEEFVFDVLCAACVLMGLAIIVWVVLALVTGNPCVLGC